MPEIVLAGPADFAGWRSAARALAAKRIPPQDVAWRLDGECPDLFSSGGPQAEARPNSPFTVPRAFIALAEQAALHSERDRFALLYRLLWRLITEPHLLEIATDPDVARLGLLARTVRRDIHKMHAFVRFRELGAGEARRYVAWYEPDHHIVEAAAPFFMRRFATMDWTILTPERSASWADGRLEYGPGATLADAPGDDPLEPLWCDYYASIFNPARLNPEAMRAEMPKRFWKNLPEASRIDELMEGAAARTRAMIASAPTLPVLRKGALRMDDPIEPLQAEGLAGLRAAACACRACPLWAPATQTVFGEGPSTARLMLIGEQPGDQEDIAGRPFVGPAGQMLDRALAEAGIDREQIYVTNAVKHFKFEPRGKRRLHQKPNSLEIKACHPWLEQELAQVQPTLVVALGATAAQSLFGRTMAIGANRGRLMPLGEGQALITIHPSYLLRLPDEAAKQREYRAFIADLTLAKESLSDERRSR
jgi:DNA polymerase